MFKPGALVRIKIDHASGTSAIAGDMGIVIERPDHRLDGTPWIVVEFEKNVSGYFSETIACFDVSELELVWDDNEAWEDVI